MYIKKIFLTIFSSLILISCGGTTTSNDGTTPTSGGTNDSNDTNKSNIDSDLAFTNQDINISLDHLLYKNFGVGFGNSGAFGFEDNTDSTKAIWLRSMDLIIDSNIENNSYYKGINKFDAGAFDVLQQKLQSSKYIVYWLTKGWKESWFSVSSIQNGMDKGVVPVFVYWIFGDTLSGGFPSDTTLNDYKVDNIKLSNFLNKLNGQKLVIMEPEFNKNVIIESINNQHNFATVISDAIDRIDLNASNILYSLCMTDRGRIDINAEFTTDCGYSNCALGDINEWKKPEIVYQDLLAKNKLDFISFQEMISQFSRDPSKSTSWSTIIPINHTDTSMGIDVLADRIVNLAKYLRNKYKKPIFMPYIGIGTATWNDVNSDNIIEISEINYNGWETQVNNMFINLMAKKNELLANNFFGFAIMSLFDNPQNDKYGYKFFLENEYHLGAIKTSAIDSNITDNSSNIYMLGDITPKQNIIDTIFN